MTVYIIALLVILYFVLTYGPQQQQKRKKLLGWWVFYIALIIGFRDMLGGYDPYIYGEIFDRSADDLDNRVALSDNTGLKYNKTEKGFGLLNIVIACFTSNRYVFLLIHALLLYSILYYHITKYSKEPFTAFFILFGLSYFFTFTYLRQVLAMAVAWFAIPYAIDRKPWKFFLIVAIAATFHNSALLFALFYFIANRQFSRTQILFYAVTLCILGLTPIGAILFKAIGSNINEEKTESTLSHTDAANLNYIVEAIFFFILIYVKYKDLPKDKVSLAMLNIALMFVYVLLFFVRFTDGGRMSWFFIIGIACTFAPLCTPQSRTYVIKWITLSMSTILYLRLLFSWGDIIYPYKTFFTNGVRPNDETWERYEYDHKYDDDKLYRPVLRIPHSD